VPALAKEFSLSFREAGKSLGGLEKCFGSFLNKLSVYFEMYRA
jgi:hypothetical protein